jgi:hypothetical protein
MMTAISKDEEVLETAIAGLSRVAQAIASMPADDRARSLEAAERSYCETAVGLGYTDGEAQDWAATVTASLRAEVEKQVSPGSPPIAPGE